ncbi:MULTISPECIES: DsbA family protein [Rhodomicrobium]|uniref:DsbA family protein n=1 Tax=Rhodomicrobium TaxID=1068 RepID=UPI000B4B70D7|nr:MULTISPECIES: DsbA family protein [Rhodomicrobium]
MMFQRKFYGAIFGAATLVAAASAFVIPSSAQDAAAFDAKQKDAIRAIVKEYLLEQPEILREAITELNKRQEVAATEERKKALATLYKQDSPFSTGSGKITLVEFFDYNCGYCRKAFDNLVGVANQEKDVRVVFVEFPILSEGSRVASQAAIASTKQGKYFPFHQGLMKYKGEVKEDVVFKVAAEVGLDVEKLKADMKLPEVDALIEKNLELGTAMGVQGTPAIFVGDEAIPGAPENLNAILKTAVAGIREKGCSVC